MKTHTTIQLAFERGTGDCFFKKDGQFIAVSRKDEQKHLDLINAGFIHMMHQEVMISAALTKTTVTAAIEWKKAHDQKATGRITKHENRYNSPDLYEFSDADPGL